MSAKEKIGFVGLGKMGNPMGKIGENRGRC